MAHPKSGDVQMPVRGSLEDESPVECEASSRSSDSHERIELAPSKQENHWKVIDNIFCITNEISFTIISLSSSDKFFLESWFSSWNYYFLTNYHWNLLSFTLYIRS